MNLIEVKFSLELTKNGVQKSIHAKTGEDKSRKAIITLTENGKVFDAESYNVAVAFDDGTFISSADARKLVVVKNGCVEFTLPGELVVASGERFCEVQVSNDNRILYSPVFRVLVEKSLGQDGMKEPVGNTIRHQDVIPDLQSKDTISENDEIAVYTPEDELTTKRKVSALPLVNTPPELTAVTLVAMLASKDPAFASLESPDVASTSDSNFAQMIEMASYQRDVCFYYAPSSTGNLEYTEPLEGTQKTLMVKKGKAYCLFVSSNDGYLYFQTIYTLEQVEALFRLVFDDYSTPKKLSAFENDLGFVNKKQVSDIVDDEVREYLENNPIEGVGLTEEQATAIADNTKARHTHSNKTVLDKFSVDADNKPLFDGNPIVSESGNVTVDPVTTAAQTVAILLNGGMLNSGGVIYSSVESVDIANNPDSDFQVSMQSVTLPPAYGGSVVVYSPPQNGNVEYTDPMTNEQINVSVLAGVVYIFYLDEETYTTTYTTQGGTGLREILLNGINM